MNAKAYYFVISTLVLLGVLLGVFFFPNFDQVSIMLYYDKRYNIALDRYEEAARKDGKDTPLSIASPLSWIYLNFARTEDAVHVVEEYVKQNPDNLDAKIYLYNLYKQVGDVALAGLLLRDIYPSAPSKENANELLGNYLILQDVPGIIWATNQLIADYAASPDQYAQLIYLYASGGQMNLALQTVDKLRQQEAGLKWSIDNLTLAVSLYSQNNQNDKVLSLVDEQMHLGLKEREILDLVYLLQQKGMPRESLVLLDKLPADYQNNPEVILARFNIAAETDTPEQLYRMLVRYFEAGRLPDEYVSDLASSALDKGNYDILQQLFAIYPLDLFHDEMLLNLVLNAEQHRFPEIIAFLKERSETTSPFNPFIAYFIKMGDLPDAEDPETTLSVPPFDSTTNYQRYLLAKLFFAKNYRAEARNELAAIDNLRMFDKWALAELSQLYIDLNEAERGYVLASSVRSEDHFDYPVDAWLRLAAATNHTDEVIEYLEKTDKVSGRLLKDIFYTAYNNKNGPLAVFIAKRITELSTKVQYKEMLSEAYILDGDLAKGVALLQELYQNDPKHIDHYIDILFLASQKDPKYKEELFSLVAQRLKEEPLPEKRMLDLGSIYFYYKMNAEALPLFYKLAADKPYRSDAVQTLLSIFGAHPDKEEMQWVLAKTEKAPGEEKIHWINYLIDIQAPKDALAFMDEGDLQSKSYRKVYLKAIDAMIYELSKSVKKKPEVKPELRSWIMKGLAVKGIPSTKRREWGFILIDAGYKQDALPIFLALAGKKPYKNEDVQTLLSLWGEKPPREGLEWMAARTMEVNTKQKKYWLQYLLDIKQPEIALHLVQEVDLKYDPVLDIYLQTLAELKMKDCIAALLEELVPREERPKRLNHLGTVAQDANLPDFAIAIFEKLLTIDPNYVNAHKSLGGLYFGKGALGIAQCHLERYLILHPQGDYMSFYYLGEIFYVNKHFCWAYSYFRQSLLLSQKEKEHSIYLQSTQAQLFYRLRNPGMAIALYSDIMDRAPDNLNIRTDFGNMLIDLEMWSMAKRALFCPTINDIVWKGEYDDVLNLTIAQLRYLREVVEPCRALELMDEVFEDNYTYPPLIAAKAELELSVDRWQSAQDYLLSALEHNPLNEGLAKAWRDIQVAYQEYVAFEGEYRITNVIQKEKFERIWVDAFISANTKFNFYGENDFLIMDSYTNINGVTKFFKGNRCRADISFLQYLEDGQTFRGSLYLGDGVTGVGAKWTSPNYYGVWGLKAMYHRPCWEFVQSTIEFGSQDQIEVTYKPRMLPRWDGLSYLQYNIYNIKHLNRAASTVAMGGNVAYRFANYTPIGRLLCEQDAILLNYNLDAEYGLNNVERRAADGTLYFPLPFVSRENHALTLNVRKKYRDNFNFEIYGGYLYNRLAGPTLAPLYGSYLILGRPGEFQLRLEYNHTVSTESGGGVVDRYLFNLLYPLD